MRALRPRRARSCARASPRRARRPGARARTARARGRGRPDDHPRRHAVRRRLRGRAGRGRPRSSTRAACAVPGDRRRLRAVSPHRPGAAGGGLRARRSARRCATRSSARRPSSSSPARRSTWRRRSGSRSPWCAFATQLEESGGDGLGRRSTRSSQPTAPRRRRGVTVRGVERAAPSGSRVRAPRGARVVRIVIALGGNALLRRGRTPRGRRAARQPARRGARAGGARARATSWSLTHGNGPQIGWLALQAEALPEARGPIRSTCSAPRARR